MKEIIVRKKLAMIFSLENVTGSLTSRIWKLLVNNTISSIHIVGKLRGHEEDETDKHEE